jgi:hypothetical protein
MAFRIHDSVVRGEIDNRTKGIVRGKIWVEGRVKPIVLELKGNALARPCRLLAHVQQSAQAHSASRT